VHSLLDNKVVTFNVGGVKFEVDDTREDNKLRVLKAAMENWINRIPISLQDSDVKRFHNDKEFVENCFGYVEIGILENSDKRKLNKLFRYYNGCKNN
tara:strand:- start:81 stop:371 length:291 start_codon:yes stop_codon:yes gene_type:complete